MICRKPSELYLLTFELVSLGIVDASSFVVVVKMRCLLNPLKHFYTAQFQLLCATLSRQIPSDNEKLISLVERNTSNSVSQ